LAFGFASALSGRPPSAASLVLDAALAKVAAAAWRISGSLFCAAMRFLVALMDLPRLLLFHSRMYPPACSVSAELATSFQIFPTLWQCDIDILP
jgi:hypothetical protein